MKEAGSGYVIKRIFAGDILELDIHPDTGKRKQASKCNLIQDTKTEKHREVQARLNGKRSRQAFEYLVLQNFTGGDIYLTLTYASDNLPEKREAEKNVEKFIRRLRYRMQREGLDKNDLRYVYVTETEDVYGMPCRIHHHMLMSRNVPFEMIRDAWNLGSVNKKTVGSDWKNLSGIAGYMMKTSESREKAERRWCASSHLKRPVITKENCKYSLRLIEHMTRDSSFCEEIINDKLGVDGYRMVNSDAYFNDFTGLPYIRVRLVKNAESVLDSCEQQEQVQENTDDSNPTFLLTEQDSVLSFIRKDKHYFITGGAGTGKTYNLRLISDRLRQEGKNVMIIAPTGIAAIEAGGTTIHLALGMSYGSPIDPQTMQMSIRTPPALMAADVIIVDEISMVRMDIFDALCCSVREAERITSRPKQIIVVGDFFQLPPVLDCHGGEKQLLDAYYGYNIRADGCYAFCGKEWGKMHFTTLILTSVYRQRDKEFIQNLNKARIGASSCVNYFNHQVDSGKPYHDSDICLYASNNQVDIVNQYKMTRIPGNPFVKETVCSDALRKACGDEIPDDLVLKNGARVMITSNDTAELNALSISPDGTERVRDSGGRFCNGSLGTVRMIGEDSVVVQTDDGSLIKIPRKKYYLYKYTVNAAGKLVLEKLGSYKQFPLRLAYAISIHKSQGQTFKRARINPWGCISYGQLYVALSRVTGIDGLSLEEKIESFHLVTSENVKRFYARLMKHAISRK